MGVISPLGVGSDATWQAIQNGHSGVRTVPEWVEANWPIPICGDVVDFEPKQYVKPRKSLKVMSRETQLGFSAAMLVASLCFLPPDLGCVSRNGSSNE